MTTFGAKSNGDPNGGMPHCFRLNEWLGGGEMCFSVLLSIPSPRYIPDPRPLQTRSTLNDRAVLFARPLPSEYLPARTSWMAAGPEMPGWFLALRVLSLIGFGCTPTRSIRTLSQKPLEKYSRWIESWNSHLERPNVEATGDLRKTAKPLDAASRPHWPASYVGRPLHKTRHTRRSIRACTF